MAFREKISSHLSGEIGLIFLHVQRKSYDEILVKIVILSFASMTQVS